MQLHKKQTTLPPCASRNVCPVDTVCSRTVTQSFVRRVGEGGRSLHSSSAQPWTSVWCWGNALPPDPETPGGWCQLFAVVGRPCSQPPSRTHGSRVDLGRGAAPMLTQTLYGANGRLLLGKAAAPSAAGSMACGVSWGMLSVAPFKLKALADLTFRWPPHLRSIGL